MGNGIYNAVAGSVASLRSLESVSRNLAQVNTPGFKAEIATFEQKLYEANGEKVRQVTPGKVGVKLEQGGLRETGNPLDVALNGDGFLVVDTPAGSRLTRSGRLVVGADGVLKSVSGSPVRGVGGSIVVPPSTDPNAASPLVIDKAGVVSRGAQVLGALLRVNATPDQLGRDGPELFTSSEPPESLPPSTCEVLQSHLEEANVSPVMAMTSIITAQRVFDALQQAVKTYRELDSQSTRRMR